MSEEAEASTEIWERVHKSLAVMQTRSQMRQSNSAEMAEKLAQRARVFRERVRSPQAEGTLKSLLTFSSNLDQFALPLPQVLEIQPLKSFSPVPGAPAYVLGVVHFRGTILSLIDLSRLFGAREAGIADVHFYIVAHAAGHRVALAAGSVDDLMSVPEDSIRPAPHWGENHSRQWISGIHGDRHVVLQLGAILSDETLIRGEASLS